MVIGEPSGGVMEVAAVAAAKTMGMVKAANSLAASLLAISD